MNLQNFVDGNGNPHTSDIDATVRLGLEARACIAAVIGGLTQRIEELERQAGVNSGNSSQPPSADARGNEPQKPKPSRRKRGGQPGHPKRTRPLIPPEDCDDVQDHRLPACDQRGTRLSGHQEFAAHVRSGAVVNMDETGWREDGRRGWLWTVVGPLATLFTVRLKRSQEVVHDLIGVARDGIVGSDRYSTYHDLPDDRHRFWRAHLLRAPGQVNTARP